MPPSIRSAEVAASRAAPQQYLNRLSDLLFILARVLNRDPAVDGAHGDVYWKSGRETQDGA